MSSVPSKPVCVEGLTLHEISVGPARFDVTKLLGTMALSTSSKFPGPSPVSIERANFASLRDAPYLICEKTDGWRAALMLVKYKDLQLVLLFDRKLTPYIIKVEKVPVALWQGSLFDGEMVYNKKLERWTYIIFDALRVAGIPIMHRRFSERLAVAVHALNMYGYVAKDSVDIRIKMFLPREDVGAFPGHLANVQQEFSTDGMLLTPDVPGVIFGRHRAFYKLKTKHSVDFLVSPSGKSLLVYDPRARMHVEVGELKTQDPALAGGIVECVRETGHTWVLVQLRTDKKEANDMLTYQKTLLNAQENITVSEMCSVL